MNLQRYDFYAEYGLSEEESDDGDYVKYSDVAEYVKAIREECADICDLYHFADSAAIEIRALNKD